MRAGKMDAGNYGDMYRALSAMQMNDPIAGPQIADPEQFARNAALAGGQLANENTAITTGWADKMATRDTNNAIRQRNAEPRTETEVLAAALSSLPMDERANLAQMKNQPAAIAQYEYGVNDPKFREYELQNKSKQPGFRMTTDAEGNPVFEYGTDLGSALTPNNQFKLHQELRDLDKLDALLNEVEGLNKPENLGVTGQTRMTVVGAEEQGRALMDYARNLVGSDPGFTIPAPSDDISDVARLNYLSNALAYAEVKAQDPRVSDNDYRVTARAQQLRGLLSSTAGVQAYINQKREMNKRDRTAVETMLFGAPREGLNTPANPGAMGQATNPAMTTPYDQITPEAVQITGDADYEALPSGTEFIDPDGVRRRKP